jgi:hypothetical protein
MILLFLGFLVGFVSGVDMLCLLDVLENGR